MSLRCTINIDPAVDIPYTIRVTWMKSGALIVGSDRIIISNVTRLSPYTHEAYLSWSTLSSASDTGTYTCQATVSSESSLLYVRGTSQTDMETITVQGKCVYKTRL